MNKMTLPAEKIIEQLQISTKCFDVWKLLNLGTSEASEPADEQEAI